MQPRRGENDPKEEGFGEGVVIGFVDGSRPALPPEGVFEPGWQEEKARQAQRARANSDDVLIAYSTGRTRRNRKAPPGAWVGAGFDDPNGVRVGEKRRLTSLDPLAVRGEQRVRRGSSLPPLALQGSQEEKVRQAQRARAERTTRPAGALPSGPVSDACPLRR